MLKANLSEKKNKLDVAEILTSNYLERDYIKNALVIFLGMSLRQAYRDYFSEIIEGCIQDEVSCMSLGNIG